MSPVLTGGLNLWLPEKSATLTIYFRDKLKINPFQKKVKGEMVNEYKITLYGLFKSYLICSGL